MKLRGVIPPMLTPAADDGMTVDRDKLGKLVSFLIEGGVNGLFTGASAGETFMLDRTQRQIAFETVVTSAAGRVPVVAGISAFSTADALQYARDAEAAGASYVIGLAPGLFPMSEDEIIYHFATIAGKINIPMLMYNFPEVTGGKKITPRILGELTRKHRVVGIKDSSGEIGNTRAYRRECGDAVSLIMGADRLISAHLMLGGDGFMCSGINMAPKAHAALYVASLAGDSARMIAIQDAVAPLVDICLTGTFPDAVKSCMASQGMPVGPPFLPVLPATDAQSARAKQLLDQVQAAVRDLGIN